MLCNQRQVFSIAFHATGHQGDSSGNIHRESKTGSENSRKPYAPYGIHFSVECEPGFPANGSLSNSKRSLWLLLHGWSMPGSSLLLRKSMQDTLILRKLLCRSVTETLEMLCCVGGKRQQWITEQRGSGRKSSHSRETGFVCMGH